MIHYLEKAGVKLLNCSTVTEITPLMLALDIYKLQQSVPDPYNTWSPILQKTFQIPLHQDKEQI
jgi:hypothetical protein